MANVLSNMFTDIAGAIREKTGDTATMKPVEFAEKIRTIPSDGEGVDPYYSKAAYALATRNAEYISGNSKVLQLRNFKDVTTGYTLGQLNAYSMAGFRDVEVMSFSGLMMMTNNNVFVGCTSLKIIDFTITNTIGMMISEGVFNDCSSLQHVIFRGDTAFNLINVNSTHSSTPNFYIYVPRANYSAVIAKLNSISGSGHIKDTSRFRILEDYPDVNNWEANYT